MDASMNAEAFSLDMDTQVVERGVHHLASGHKWRRKDEKDTHESAPEGCLNKAFAGRRAFRMNPCTIRPRLKLKAFGVYRYTAEGGLI